MPSGEVVTMDLSDAPDEERFRDGVRAWLRDSLPRLPWPEPSGLEEKAPFWRQWQHLVSDAGYAGLTWPREYGGQGLDERMRAMVEDLRTLRLRFAEEGPAPFSRSSMSRSSSHGSVATTRAMLTTA